MSFARTWGNVSPHYQLVAVLLAIAAGIAVVFASAGVSRAGDNDGVYGTISFKAASQAQGVVETWTVLGTYADGDTNDAVSANDTIILEWPTNFTVPAVPVVTALATAAVLTNTAAPTADITTITLSAGETDAIDNTEVMTLTVAGVTNPVAGSYSNSTTQAATAGFSINGNEATEVAAAAVSRIWNLAIAATPTSVPADGISAVTISLTPSSASENLGGGLLTVTTTTGQFIAAGATSGNAWDDAGAALALAGDGLSAADTVEPAVAAAADQILLQAPATAGTSTVKSFVSGGGAATQFGSLTITWSAVAASPVLTGITMTPTSTTPVSSSGAAGTHTSVTAALTDQNGAAFAAGTTVTATVTAGAVIDGNGTTCTLNGDGNGKDAGSDASCTFSSTGAADEVNVYGTGVAGSYTLTFSATALGVTVTATKAITLTGDAVSSLSMDMVSGFAATTVAITNKNIVNDRGVAAGDTKTDEILVVVKALDADGNAILPATLNVTFATTDADGAVVTGLLDNTAEEIALAAGNACGITITATLGTCVDNFEAGAGGGTGATARAGAVAVITVDNAATAPRARGTYTVTATWGTGATAKTVSGTFVVAGPTDAIALTDGTTELGGTVASLTATATDSDGNPVADGTSVNFAANQNIALLLNATTGAQLSGAVVTSAGAASVNVVGVSAGVTDVLGLVSTTQGAGTVTVTDPNAVVVEEVAIVDLTGFSSSSAGGLGVWNGGATTSAALAPLLDADTYGILRLYDEGSRTYSSCQGVGIDVPGCDGFDLAANSLNIVFFGENVS